MVALSGVKWSFLLPKLDCVISGTRNDCRLPFDLAVNDFSDCTLIKINSVMLTLWFEVVEGDAKSDLSNL